MRKQRLELDWVGKDEVQRLEPRILIYEKEKSYGNLSSENLLIHGDNLLALKALEQDYSNKVKCVYIDPPYNTGAAFEQYDDGIEHSLWLSLIRDRLAILKKLISDDGSIWINLDDNEAHYCKVLCDEIFGRSNFVANVIWEKSDSPRMDAKYFSTRHDHILVYAKNKSAFKVNGLRSEGEEGASHYDKVDDKGLKYYLKPLRTMGGADSRSERPNLYFGMIAPDGTEVFPKKKDGTDGAWRWSKERTENDAHLIEWVNGRSGWTPYYRIYEDKESTRPPETIWTHADVGSNRTSAAEVKSLFDGVKAFDTPKPEKLIHRILSIATNEGDLVLDSFAGSGTTGAVAHKMKRKWIMVELGNHCETLIVPRMKKVIDGVDSKGVTALTGWESGGGFRYFKLAPSLLQKDSHGNWIISPKYNAIQLAEAVCKHEGFKFWPDQNLYWKQGYSTEKDFIFVTTEFLTADRIDRIASAMKPDETLLICAKAFRVPANKHPNITVKKIPQMLLGRYEFGRDDYSLNVKEPVQEEMELDEADI